MPHHYSVPYNYVHSPFNICLSGMKFHKDERGRYLPIIVQGDPRKPRGKPRVSLGDPSNKPREGQFIIFTRLTFRKIIRGLINTN